MFVTFVAQNSEQKIVLSTIRKKSTELGWTKLQSVTHVEKLLKHLNWDYTWGPIQNENLDVNCATKGSQETNI